MFSFIFIKCHVFFSSKYNIQKLFFVLRGMESGQWVSLLVRLNHWLSDAVSLIPTQGWRWDSQMTYEKFVIMQ